MAKNKISHCIQRKLFEVETEKKIKKKAHFTDYLSRFSNFLCSHFHLSALYCFLQVTYFHHYAFLPFGGLFVWKQLFRFILHHSDGINIFQMEVPFVINNFSIIRFLLANKQPNCLRVSEML